MPNKQYRNSYQEIECRMTTPDSNENKPAFVHIEHGEIIASSEGIDVIIAEYAELTKHDFYLNEPIEQDAYITENGLEIEIYDFIDTMAISKKQHIELARLTPHEGSGNIKLTDDKTSSERLDHFVTILQEKLEGNID